MALTYPLEAALTANASVSQGQLDVSKFNPVASIVATASASQALARMYKLAVSTASATASVAAVARKLFNAASNSNVTAAVSASQAIAAKSKFQAYANTPISVTASVAQADLSDYFNVLASLSATISVVNSTAAQRAANRFQQKEYSPPASFTGFGYPNKSRVLDAAESYDTNPVWKVKAFGGAVTFDAGCTAASGYFAPSDGDILANGVELETRLTKVAVKAGSSGDLLYWAMP